MEDANYNPVFHLMGELGINSFLLVGVDSTGHPVILKRANSPAGTRAVRGFAEDWLDKEMELAISWLEGDGEA